jgi:hypothetical protein
LLILTFYLSWTSVGLRMIYVTKIWREFHIAYIDSHPVYLVCLFVFKSAVVSYTPEYDEGGCLHPHARETSAHCLEPWVTNKTNCTTDGHRTKRPTFQTAQIMFNNVRKKFTINWEWTNSFNTKNLLAEAPQLNKQNEHSVIPQQKGKYRSNFLQPFELLQSLAPFRLDQSNAQTEFRNLSKQTSLMSPKLNSVEWWDSLRWAMQSTSWSEWNCPECNPT